MLVFKDSAILITGGTGSLGKALIEELLANSEARKIAIFSRDELKQLQLKNHFNNDSRLRWFLGDIRDQQRLSRAMHGIDFVIHAAALKQVDTGEYNPMEFIKTNVLGSQNVIEASIDAKVKKWWPYQRIRRLLQLIYMEPQNSLLTNFLWQQTITAKGMAQVSL